MSEPGEETREEVANEQQPAAPVEVDSGKVGLQSDEAPTAANDVNTSPEKPSEKASENESPQRKEQSPKPTPSSPKTPKMSAPAPDARVPSPKKTEKPIEKVPAPTAGAESRWSGEPRMLHTEHNRPVQKKYTYYLLLALKTACLLVSMVLGLFQSPRKRQLPPIHEPLLLLSAAEISARIKKRTLKCEQIVRAYIARIEQVQRHVNAVVDSRFDDAINDAKKIDEQLRDESTAAALMRKPLLGVPFTCKDSIAMAGMLQTSGSWYRRNVKAEQDAPVVANLRAAGAIPLAITNVPEFVMWFETNNTVFGRTNNPYDLSRTVGGSSGGEGALIASAGSLIGIGSDVGGSIRIPSMFNGVFGHKTTADYVPIGGMYPTPPATFNDLICFGPMCRYAKDLPVMLKAMSGGQADRLQLDKPVDFGKLKIYFMTDDSHNPLVSFLDDRIVKTMEKAVGHFASVHNTKTRKININKFMYGVSYFGSLMAYEQGPKMSEIITSGDGRLNPFFELVKYVLGKSKHTLPILHVCLSEYLPASRAGRCESNKQVVDSMLDLRKKFHELLGDNAVLFYPTWPTLTPKHNQSLLNSFDLSYTVIMNTMSVPSTHCPMGLDEYSQLPVGFQVIAGPGQDRLSLAVAQELEAKFGGWVQPS